ncbi:MAG: tryptophan synthase subunit alpha [Candidatus Omnitrophota bacterium]
MKNRITARFRALKARGQRAFIAYITAGDPDLSATRDMVTELERSGVDIVELGIPFSDPIADGPTIQAASHRALRKGASLSRIFGMVASLRKVTDIPIVFMTYYNPVLAYGLRRFVADCRRKGVDGVIVPDLPFEEATELVKAARAVGLATIQLVAPTSTGERIKEIARRSTGFIYYVSLTGVTGARKGVPKDLAARVKAIKSVSKSPVSVGFGVATQEQARAIAKVADGVIVGSAIVKIIERNRKDRKGLLSRVSKFAGSLARAVHGVR